VVELLFNYYSSRRKTPAADTSAYNDKEASKRKTGLKPSRPARPVRISAADSVIDSKPESGNGTKSDNPSASSIATGIRSATGKSGYGIGSGRGRNSR
jgi:hypothetical protein